MNIRQPKNPGFIGKIGFVARLSGWIAMVIWNFTVTELLTAHFLNLGLFPQIPYARLFDFPIYQPFAWGVWEWHLDITPRTASILLHGFEAQPYTSGLHWAALAGFFGSIIVLRIVPGLVARLYEVRYSADQDDLHGSAKWADEKQIRKAGLLSIESVGGVVLGLWMLPSTNRALYLRDKSEKNVLLVAAPGTGKTASAVMLTALEWDASMVVFDPKGELWRSTAGFRQSKGHRCLRFAPMEPEKSIHYNPMDFIRVGTRDEVSDAQKFASALCDPGGELKQNSHWDDIAADLVAGVVLHEMYKCRLRYKRDATMADLAFALSPYERTADGVKSMAFADYLKSILVFQHDPQGTRGWKLQDGNPSKVCPFIITAVQMALNRGGEEASGALSSAAKRLAPFREPRVVEVTSHTDLSIMDIVDGPDPVSLYFTVPPSDKDRLAPLMRLIVANMTNRLTSRERDWKHDLLFLLDEFPVLGYVKAMESVLSHSRSYGLRFFLIAQDLSQIVKTYGRNNEIVNNCQIRIVFATGNLATARDISETLGQATVTIGSFNFSGEARLIPDGTKGVTSHTHHIGRRLMDPSEIMALKLPVQEGKQVVKPGEFIAIIFGQPPILGVQAFWFLDPEIRWRVGIPIKADAPQNSFEQDLNQILHAQPR